MEALRIHFDHVDETLRIVRGDVETYRRQIDDLERIHDDLMAYVEQSRSPEVFLEKLTEALIVELTINDEQMREKDEELGTLRVQIDDLNRGVHDIDEQNRRLETAERRLQEEVRNVETLRSQLNSSNVTNQEVQQRLSTLSTLSTEQSKRLEDAEQRLNEEMTTASLLRSQLDAANSQNQVTQQQLSTLTSQQSTQGIQREAEHQQTVNDMVNYVRQRGESHSNAMSDLHVQVSAANEKLNRLREKMQASKRFTTVLARDRDEKVRQLNGKLHQLAGTVRGRAAVENDRSELGVLLSAAERAMTLSASSGNDRSPSFDRPRPPGRPSTRAPGPSPLRPPSPPRY